ELRRKAGAAFERVVEVGEPDRDVPQLLGAVVARLRVELADVVRVSLEAHGCVFRGDAACLERLALLDARYVAAEDPEQTRDRLRAGVAGALEHRLARAQHAGDVARAPRVGESEAARLATRRHDALDVVDPDAIAARPRRELVDLPRELVEVLAHQLDERAGRLRIDLLAVDLELLRDPALQAPLRHVPQQNLTGGGDRLRDRGVLLELAGDERERRRRGGGLQVRGDRLRVRGLPGVDAFDDDQTPLGGEEPERVRRSDD